MIFLEEQGQIELKCGNQRELARQKNLKKTQEIHKGKRKEDSLSASQRKQRGKLLRKLPHLTIQEPLWQSHLHHLSWD
ncbi:hypothetical protein IHE44_0011260 [Lamprotornis superbus]|uniref:Small EDRK-rich factor-like N-terminal domain-containing protein n=1 Tax=Lamprotornis superbus TaxID=245042 RepID=A0A835NLP9_9PASS|nr:hypothetical protein IHE44_0011260 [Lamprotornis superbus]